MDSELRTYLSRRLCWDVVKIIEEYVVGQARRVARAYSAIIEKIEWDIKMTIWEGPNEYRTTTKYRSGIYKSTLRCTYCCALRAVVFYNVIDSPDERIVDTYEECEIYKHRGDILPDYDVCEPQSKVFLYPDGLVHYERQEDNWYSTAWRVIIEFFGRRKCSLPGDTLISRLFRY